MPIPLRVLILGDGPEFVQMVMAELELAGYEPDGQRVRNRGEFLEALITAPDVVIGAVLMPAFDPAEAADVLAKLRVRVPIVVVDDAEGIDSGPAAPAPDGPGVFRTPTGRIARTVAAAMEGARGEQAVTAEGRLLRLIENAGNIVFRVTFPPDARVLYVSPGIHTLLGYHPHELQSNPAFFRTMMDPEDFRRLHDDLRGPAPHQGPVTMRWLRRDGQVVWVTICWGVLRNEAGDVVGVEGIANDTSLARQAAEDLRHSEEKFRALVEKLPEVIWTIDRAGRFTYLSPSIARYAGLTPEQMLGRRFDELIHPQDAPDVERTFAHALGRQGRFALETRAVTPQGDTLNIIIAGDSIVENGRIVGMRGTAFDITELRRIRDELDRQRQMTDTMLSATPDLVIFKDRDSVFRACTESTARSWGLTVDQLIGKTDFDLFPAEIAARFREQEVELMETGATLVYETRRIMQPHGEERVLETIKRRVCAPSGQVLGLVASLRDVTEHKRLEEELARRVRELTLVYETSLDLNRQADSETLLKTITQRAVEVSEAERAAVYLYDPDSQALHNVAIHQSRSIEPVMTVPVGEGVTGRVFQTGETLIVDDYRAWPGKLHGLITEPTRIMAVPVNSKQGRLGALMVADDRAGRFDDNQIRILQMLADEAAIVIERSRLHDRLQRELRDRREAEDALRRQTDFQASILDTSEALIAALDPDGRFLLFNRKCEEISGYSQEEALGRVVWDFLIPPADVDRFRQQFDNLVQSGGARQIELNWLTRAGGTAPLIWRDNVLRDPATDEVIVIGSGLDLSEMVRSRREIEEQNRELTVLYEALRAAGSSLELKHVFERVARSLSQLGGYPHVSLYLRQGDTLSLCAAVGFDRPMPVMTADQGVHGRVLRTAEAQFVRNAEVDPDFVPVIEEVDSEITVPILLDGQVAATINVESTPDLPLTDADFRLIKALAEQLSLVMRNALLFESQQAERDEVRSFNDQLLAVQQMGLAISSQLNQPGLIEAIARSAAELLDGDSGGIMLIQPDGTLTLAGAFGLSDRMVAETRIRLGDSVSGRVAATGQPMIVQDTRNDTRFDNPAASEDGILSVMSTPLKLNNRTIGTLNVHSKKRTNAFSDRHLRVFNLLANQTAVAIENARLYSAMAESEGRFRALFERTLDGLVLIDLPDGVVLDANPAFQKTLGYSLEEMRGKPIWELHPGELRDRVRRRWPGFSPSIQFQRGQTVSFEGRDGRQIHVEMSAFTLDLGGRRVLAVSTRDVTEKRLLEEQVRQAQKMEAIGTLAGGIAHDFNNILGAILRYASFLKKGLAPEDPLRSDAETIETAALRGADLTRQLLAFARGGRYELRPTDVNTVIREVIKLLGRTLDKSIIVEPALDPGLLAIEADRGQIQQLLLNLCINASEAMPGGGLLTVRTENAVLDEATAHREIGRPPGDYVLLTVTDTGHGMAPETLERLFEPFYSTKKNQPGRKHTGLGLAVVFGIVKGHNGGIRVDSEPGRGSSFRVWLRANRNVKEAVETAVDSVDARGEETILVVDDEATLRALLKRALSDVGYRVLTASNGSEAVEIFRMCSAQVGLVVLDMVMPGMSGKRTFEALREIRPDVRVFIASGYSEQGDAREILDAGALGFIQKPFHLSEILKKVRSTLDE